MKRINYKNAIGANFERLVVNPEIGTAKLCIRLISGSYANTEERAAMAEALVVWMGMNPDSVFYETLECKMRRKGNFVYHEYRLARDEFAQNLLSSTLLNDAAMSRNAYLHIASCYMALPKNVARRWLWHENVDFQSCESLLRRLTGAQYRSLVAHYRLTRKSKTEEKDLPCFTDGALNKVWRMFNLSAKEEDRMTTKSTLAHDFLGMGMGFSLYQNANNDQASSKTLASQFISKEDRGEFEVNKEEGGLYWHLYRTLRSNSLWGKGKDVQLGKWICPGFWFTMLMWGIFLVASPLSLIALVGVFIAKGVISTPLAILGAIFPTIFALSWAKEIGGKEYGGDYLKILVRMLAGIWAGFLVYLGITSLEDFWSFYAGILFLVLLLPYCVSKDTMRFWKAPVLGKVLPVVFLSTLCIDVYAYSNFFQDNWNLVVAFALYLYEIRKVLGVAFLGIALYAGMITGLIYLSRWMGGRADIMIQENDQRIYSYEKALNWAIGIIIAGLTLIMYQAESLLGSSSMWKVYSVLMVIIIPFAFFLVIQMFFRGADAITRNKISYEATFYAYWISRKDLEDIRGAILNNAFWGDVPHFSARISAVKCLTDLPPNLKCRRVARWVIEILRSVKTDEELKNAVAFITKSPLVYEELPNFIGIEILEAIFEGKTDEEIIVAIDRERKKLANSTPITSVWMEYNDWLGSVVLPRIFAFLYRLAWPLRVLWKGVCDLYRIWKAFNQACPPSPLEERPLAR